MVKFDVFLFGRPPFEVEILTRLKDITSFAEAYDIASLEKIDDFEIGQFA